MTTLQNRPAKDHPFATTVTDVTPLKLMIQSEFNNGVGHRSLTHLEANEDLTVILNKGNGTRDIQDAYGVVMVAVANDTDSQNVVQVESGATDMLEIIRATIETLNDCAEALERIGKAAS